MSNTTTGNAPTPPVSNIEPYVQQADGSFRAVKLLPRRARESQGSSLSEDRLCWEGPVEQCATAIPEYAHQPPAPIQRGEQKYEWVQAPAPVPVYVPRPVEQDAPQEEEEYYSGDDYEAHERHPGKEEHTHKDTLSALDERESSPANGFPMTTAPRRALVLDEDYDAVEPQDCEMNMDEDCA